MPNDVIIKQGDIAEYFYIIIDGDAEVCLEKRDFMYFDHQSTVRHLGLEREATMIQNQASEGNVASTFLK